MTDKSKEEPKAKKSEPVAKANAEPKPAADTSSESKQRPSLEEIRKSRNTFGGSGTFGGGKIGGGNSRGKGGGLSRPGGSARGR